MKILKHLLGIGLCLIFYLLTGELPSRNVGNTYSEQIVETWETNPGGFIELPPHSNLDPSKIVVIIPQNCGKNNALRGRYLADRLTSLEIPVSLESSIAFTLTNNSEDHQRLNSVMSGDIPIVLVGNKGKSNPTLREILFEYYLINP